MVKGIIVVIGGYKMLWVDVLCCKLLIWCIFVNMEYKYFIVYKICCVYWLESLVMVIKRFVWNF